MECPEHPMTLTSLSLQRLNSFGFSRRSCLEPQYYFDLGWTPRAYRELEADFMRNKIAGRVRIREVRGANRKFADRPRGRFSRRRNHMEPEQRNLGRSPRQMGTARSNIGIP